MNFFSLTLILFLIMDPFGNIAYFLKALQNVQPERRQWVVIREMFFAFVAMFVLYCLSEAIFSALQVSEMTLRLSSGVILFLTAIKIMYPTSDSLRARIYAEEPFIIPLAIPLIAGPSLLATVMLFAGLETFPTMMAAMSIAWVSALVILLCAAPLQRLVGNSGLIAAEKLIGMVLIMLAIQRMGEGMQQFVTTYVVKG